MTVVDRLPLRHPFPELSSRAELALLARILWREGYDDHQVGHMTYRQADGTFLALPLELGWNEVCASDVLLIDGDGNLVEGAGTVPPPIILHTEYHKARPGTTVTLHHHPRFATIWSTAGELPPVYDQLSAMLPDSAYVLYDDYDGTAEEIEPVRKMVAAIGAARCALLRNHGVFVVGDTIEQAYLNALSLEWRCRQAWMVRALAAGGRPMPDSGRQAIERGIARFNGTSPGKWEWAVRRELGLVGDVLSEQPHDTIAVKEHA
jgi:ribulose-5-phosphate 4-epimerase/fuculose-1-phosphate aldolase